MAICKASFSIPVKLVSINNFYYNERRHGLKPEAKEMQYKIFHTIMQPEIQAQFEALRAEFDPTKHVYAVEITQYVPKNVLVNKAGTISAKSIDISNSEKGLVDCLFLSKFYGDNVPYQARNLNTDDRYLVDMRSVKRVSETDKFYVHVYLYLIDLECPLK